MNKSKLHAIVVIGTAKVAWINKAHSLVGDMRFALIASKEGLELGRDFLRGIVRNERKVNGPIFYACNLKSIHIHLQQCWDNKAFRQLPRSVRGIF